MLSKRLHSFPLYAVIVPGHFWQVPPFVKHDDDEVDVPVCETWYRWYCHGRPCVWNMIQMILSRSSLCVKHDTDDTVAVAPERRPGTDNWSTYGSSFLDTDNDLHSPPPPPPSCHWRSRCVGSLRAGSVSGHGWVERVCLHGGVTVTPSVSSSLPSHGGVRVHQQWARVGLEASSGWACGLVTDSGPGWACGFVTDSGPGWACGLVTDSGPVGSSRTVGLGGPVGSSRTVGLGGPVGSSRTVGLGGPVGSSRTVGLGGPVGSSRTVG